MATSGLASGLIEDQFPSEGIVCPQDFLWLTNPKKKKRFCGMKNKFKGREHPTQLRYPLSISNTFGFRLCLAERTLITFYKNEKSSPSIRINIKI